MHFRTILSRGVVNREGNEVHAIVNQKGEQTERESGTSCTRWESAEERTGKEKGRMRTKYNYISE